MYGKKILKSDVYSLPSQSQQYNRKLADENCNVVRKEITFDKNSGEYVIYLEWEENTDNITYDRNSGGGAL